MNINYKEKYLKYKEKYLILKNKIKNSLEIIDKIFILLNNKDIILSDEERKEALETVSKIYERFIQLNN